MKPGKIHSIDTFSTLDGPGIRTVVFMQGCALRCQYCQNPDTWKVDSPSAQEFSPDQLMQIVRRGIPYFKASGGGLTISGGEPLLQHQFVRALFSQCRLEGIATALDTSLYVSSSFLLDVLPVTDLVLADIKHMDPVKSKILTGAENDLNLHNLDIINEQRVPIWLRYVLVPGLTDDLQDITAMARLAARLSQVRRIDLLPYHTLGRHKWELLGLEYQLPNLPPPEPSDIKHISELAANISGKPVFSA